MAVAAAFPSPYVETCPIPGSAVGPLHIDFSFVLDQLSLVMLLVVTGVGFLIHIYSVGYMARRGRLRALLQLPQSLSLLHDRPGPGRQRSADVRRLGRRRVSPPICSSASVSAGNPPPTPAKKPSSSTASATSAFSSESSCCWPTSARSPSAKSAQSSRPIPAWTGGVLTVICLCLLFGAAGKSAQLPLYVWLPDAMEGPTPVSALIHAATMVTAGVYMIARTHFLFDRAPFALGVVAIVGAATALFAATIGLVQNDIKRVLAYSTISQLGYMFLGCGVAAYSAAIFHLVTHAFFKALLFLAAGSVIHAMGGEQDLRKMGGLRRETSRHLLDHDRGRPRHRRILPLRRLLLERRHPLRRLPSGDLRQGPLVRRPRHRAAHLALHVPPLVHGLLRRAAHRRCSSPRKPRVHARPARHSRPAFHLRRLDRHRTLRRIPRSLNGRSAPCVQHSAPRTHSQHRGRSGRPRRLADRRQILPPQARSPRAARPPRCPGATSCSPTSTTSTKSTAQPSSSRCSPSQNTSSAGSSTLPSSAASPGCSPASPTSRE